MGYERAWEAYAEGTFGPAFEEWAAENLTHTLDVYAGKPLVLEDWQRDFFYEALALDENDHAYWRTVVLLVGRKNSKSTMLAAYSLFHLFQAYGKPEVLLTASSDKQAGRLFDYIISFLYQNDALLEEVHMQNYDGRITHVDSGGTINRLANDARRLQGWNPSIVITDELAQWTTPGLKEAWQALSSGGGARRNAQIFCISTAGYAHQRDESPLGQLVDANEATGDLEKRGMALTVSRNHETRTLVYNYNAPVRHKSAKAQRQDFEAVRAANPASWITDDYLRQQIASPALTDSAFLSLHCGIWSESTETFLPLDAWKSLGNGEEIAPGRPVCIGIDGSYVHDTTVVAVASVADDGKIDLFARIFATRQEAPHHELHKDKINFKAVEDYIVSLFDRYRVIAAGYDPRFLARSVEILDDRLPEANLIVIEPQSRQMRDAVASIHRGVTDKALRHTNDAAVNAHIAATVATQDEKGFQLKKRAHSKPIDATVALSIAHWLAQTFGNVSYEIAYFTEEELTAGLEEEYKWLFQ